MEQSSAAHLKYTWRAFNNGEYQKAIEYAESCIFQYSKKAKLMQERLDDFVKGELMKSENGIITLQDKDGTFEIKIDDIQKGKLDY